MGGLRVWPMQWDYKTVKLHQKTGSRETETGGSKGRSVGAPNKCSMGFVSKASGFYIWD